MEVILPGGLETNGSVERHARFRPLTGRVEQALLESDMSADRSASVTAMLCASLEKIGNQTADTKHVAALCVADRQYLMLRLAAMLHGEQMWLKVDCGYCDALFDIDIRRDELPVKAAGLGFPLATFSAGDVEITARVPTGADQECIGQLQDEDAIRRLLSACIYTVNGHMPDRDFFNQLSDADIEVIDKALDEVSPAVCNLLQVVCPECGREQQAELDHYSLGGMRKHFFYDEVHTLASHYHWSEAEILELPQARRHLYLDIINRSVGVSEHGALP